MKTTRPYVGIKHDDSREIFHASAGPTEELYGTIYKYVIGPFMTVRGAKFMRDYGRNNPNCQHVSDAERLAQPKAVFFAMNRHNKTAVILTGFSCWEEVQGAFRTGILMPDNSSANGIGRVASTAEFMRRAENGGITVLLAEPITLLPQPVPSFSNRACADCGEWSASGGPLCEDCAEDALGD